MKKMLSIIIAMLMLMMTIPAGSVSALVEGSCTPDQYSNFTDKVKEARSHYGCTDVMSGARIIEYPTRTTATFTAFWNLCNDTLDFLNSHVCYQVTPEELKEMDDALQDSILGLRIDPCELDAMIKIAKEETNNDNYYDESTWNDFRSVIEESEAVLGTGDIDKIHNQYLKIRIAYNNLCKYNTTFGDTNGDGSVDIRDATLMQKYSTKIKELNSSQIFVSQIGTHSYDDFNIDIKDATLLQKKVTEEAKIPGDCCSNLTKLMNYNLTMDEYYFSKEDERSNASYFTKVFKYVRHFG